MSTERGLMIQETVRAMNQEHYLRQLAKQRDRRVAQKKRSQKKEADTAATVTTSKDLCPNKSLDNYTTNEEECQPSQSPMVTALPKGEPYSGNSEEREVADIDCDAFNAPGNSSGREIRQQGPSKLPVHLL